MSIINLPPLEFVADKVHEAWMKSKKEQGVKSRKAEDGEELMVPYYHLSEKAKDLDRNTVKAVYQAIEDVTISHLHNLKYEELPPIAHRYGG